MNFKLYVKLIICTLLIFTAFSTVIPQKTTNDKERKDPIAGKLAKDKYGQFMEINKVVAEDVYELERKPVIFSLKGVRRPSHVMKIVLQVKKTNGELVFGEKISYRSSDNEFRWYGRDNMNSRVSKMVMYLLCIDVYMKDGFVSKFEQLFAFEKKDIEPYIIRVPEHLKGKNEEFAPVDPVVQKKKIGRASCRERV